MAQSQPIIPTMYPYFVYRDAAAAMKWLSVAFGFEKIQAYTAPDGSVLHAEMRFGAGAILLTTASDEQAADGPWDRPSGRGIYVYVEDVDAHFARAQAAGAQIVFPPEGTEWGTRRYRALDLEGYEWSFGSYRPDTTG